VLDRDRGAARNLAALVGEVTGGTSSHSCGATVNEPDGNPHQTHTTWAADTVTGKTHKANATPQGNGYPNTTDTLQVPDPTWVRQPAHHAL
jgi:putative transposase